MTSYFVVYLENSVRKYSIQTVNHEEEILSFFSEKNQVVIYFLKLPFSYSIYNLKIKPDEVIEIIDSLFLIVKSGLPLHQGLIDLATDSDSKNFKKIILHMAELLEKGHPLSYAFSKFPKSFNSMILTLIKIGEETGQLEFTLNTASSYLKKNLALKRKVKQALIYPGFAFVAVLLAMVVWIVYVLPEVTVLFKQMNVPLPPLTIFVIDASSFLNENIFYLAGGIFFSLFSFIYAFSHNEKLNLVVNKVLLKTPVIKNIISGFNIALIMDYLKLSLASGVPLFSALNSLYDNTKNIVFKKAIDSIRQDVISGHSLSYSFKKTNLFSSFIIRMISTGEESGNLERQLDFVSEHYNTKVYYYAENLGKVIEPIIILFVGGFMGFIMMALMSPIYDLIATINK